MKRAIVIACIGAGLSIGAQAALPVPATLTSAQASVYGMTTPKTTPGQSATLLPDGRWLLIGGLVNGEVSGATYIVDPASSTRTVLTATLNMARAWQSATLLPNGQVFIFGGVDMNGNPIAQAELYDPASQSFSLLPPTGLTPRSHHTANLLMNGEVLLTGGAEFAPAQLWDPDTNQVTAAANGMMEPRQDAASSLLGTSPVLIWGGTGANGQPANQAEWFLPSSDIFAWAKTGSSLLPPLSAAPVVADSTPGNGDQDVAITSRLALEFNERLQVTTLTRDSVTLMGPAGQVAARVVPAEQGMLLFVTPDEELLPDTNYTLFVHGARALDGAALPLVTLSFRTQSLSSGAGTQASTGSGGISVSYANGPSASPGVWQPPSGNYASNWFMGPVQRAIQANVPMLEASAGVTALSGQLLLQNGMPLPGVVVYAGNAQTTTDSAGRFLLQHLPSGHIEFIVNGRTANTANVQYGQFVIGADLNPGVTTTLSYTVWMPVIDTAHAVNIPSPTIQEVDVTSPLMPGVVLKIPAGVVIREPNGKIVTQVSLTPVPLDRAPFPLPPARSIYFVVQPGGATLESVNSDQPVGAQLVYPNTYQYAPRTREAFWYYDPANTGWMIYGHGRVSPGGHRILPDPDVQIQSFTAYMDGQSFNPPASKNQPVGGCSTAGDPVDCSTGLFLYHHVDMVLPDTVPIIVARDYQSSDTYPRQFGVGFSAPWGMYLYDAAGPTDTNFTTLSLALPDGSLVQYTRTSSSPPTGLTGLQMAATNTPSMFYGSTITYDGAHNYLVLTLKDGTQYNFHAGDGRWLRQIVNRNGQTLQIIPAPPGDASGENYPAVTLISPNGRSIQIQYESSNPIAYPQGTSMIASITDNSGRTVSYTYDSSNRLKTVTYPDGGVEQYTYNGATDEIQSIILPNGQTQVTNTYDSNGRVTQQVLADGGTYTFAYVTSGSQVTQTTVTDPNGNVRVLNFNSSGYVTSETDASGTAIAETTTYTRDPASNLVQTSTDALGRVTNFGYNSMGDLTGLTYLFGTSNAVTYQFTFNATFNELTGITDPLGHNTAYGYDSYGDLTSIKNALGTTVASITYNTAMGLPTKITDALGHAVTLAYTGGDLTSVTDALGRKTTRYPDSIGRVISVVDPLGNRTLYGYDPMNRVTSITDALGEVTTLVYDLDGNLKKVTDARSGLTQFGYDTSDRETSRTDALGQTETFGYDLNNNLTGHTDRKGQSQELNYDQLNRLAQVTYKTTGGSTESTVTYNYDLGNRVTSVVDSTGGTLIENFDGLDRLQSEISPQGSVSYQYDTASRRTQMTVAGQAAVNYGYDNADRLTGITQGGQNVVIHYDNANRRSTLTLPNGIKLSYGYDNANELTGLTYTLGANPVGNLTYGYDSDSRIITRGGTLDVTNLPAALASTSYDADNRLTKWGGTTLGYDANGNLTGDGTNIYSWNARDQLTGITGGTTASFVYDALGRRESKNISGTATNFLYDGLNIEQELNGTSPTVNYLTGENIDETFSRTDSSGTESYLTDNLGSTIALTSSAGAISTSYTYEPYGNTTQSGTSSTNAIQYTGRENDGDGLYYYRARYYNPPYGRFISEDPIGFAGGLNLYVYTQDNPLSYRDELGLCGTGLNNPAECRNLLIKYGPTPFILPLQSPFITRISRYLWYIQLVSNIFALERAVLVIRLYPACQPLNISNLARAHG